MHMTFVTEISIHVLVVMLFYLLSVLQYYLQEDHLRRLFHQPLVNYLLEALGKPILLRNSPQNLSLMILQLFQRRRPCLSP